MISSTVENYLKAAYIMSHDQPVSEPVSLGGVAERLKVTPGTVTTMVKHLANKGLVSYKSRQGLRLTEEGQQLAASVLRKHRLVERFLVDVLGLDDEAVHAEAEVLEHSLSDLVINRIDAFLGYPELDPHGSPIPGEDGVMRGKALQSLADCSVGTYMVCKIASEDAAFVQWLNDNGLQMGSALEMVLHDTHRDLVAIKTDSQTEPITLGMRSAAKLMVR